MPNINDAEFAALGEQGFTGNLNSRELQWLQANGATSGNINDAWREMLREQGFPGNRNDGFFALLGSLGYTGSRNDRELAFWTDGGHLTPPSVLVNALVYAVTTALEQWNMDTSPFVSIPLITDYPEASALGLDYSSELNMLAIAGEDLHLYRTDANPFVLLQTIPLSGTGYNFVRFSADSTRLFVGSSITGDNYIFNTADWTSAVINSDALNGAALNGNGTRLVTARPGSLGGFRINVWDVTTLPPVQLASPSYANSGEWGACDIHPVHNFLMIQFVGGSQIYAHNLNTNTFIGVFASASTHGMRFNKSGSGFCYLTAAGLTARGSASSTPASWTTIPVAAAAQINGGTTGGLSFSRDSRYLSVYQPLTAGARRIVFDLSVSPIVRVASFDVAGSASFSAAAIVGFTGVFAAFRETEIGEQRVTEESLIREVE